MNDGIDRAERDRLRAELAELRERLEGMNAPPFEATALPPALAMRRTAAAASPPSQARPTVARGLRRRLPLAAAAVLALAALAALLAARHDDLAPRPGTGARVPAPTAADVAVAEPDAAAAAFQPLMYAPGLSTSDSYSVVRVRIPLSALAQGSRLEGTIEADLLVGQDGLASGIRFASTDTFVVSTVSPCCGERR